MATNRKFNVRHGLTAGAGATQKDVVSDSGLVFDVGTLSTLKTVERGNTVGAINELYDIIQQLEAGGETSEPMGVLDTTTSSISFSNSTKQLSMALANGATEFVVWTKGIRRVYTTTQTVSIGASPATGLYYIYFNAAGVLSSKTTEFTWNEDTPVACVYWNDVTARAEFVCDERHGVVLDWATHEYLHKTQGAKIYNGFDLTAYSTSGDGSANSNATVDLTNGVFFDEDLEIAITHSASPTNGTFTQILQGEAEIPIIYQSQAGGAWVRDVPSVFPVKFNTGERIRYNQFSGGNWSNQQVDSGKYTITWVIATSDIYYPVMGIMGQGQYNSVSEAEAVLFSDLALSNFPLTEFRPLWKLIFQTSSSYTNTPKARLAGISDLRQILSGATGKTTTDHGLLSGLGDDDHSQYVHTTVDRTISANHTITGNLTLSSGLKDRLGNLGSAGQYLVSTGSGIEWRFNSAVNVLYVAKNGNDSNTGTSPDDAKLTIKAALAIATPGTVVKVAAGVYTENNPVTVPAQVSVVGDSLREVSVTPQNNDDLFYVGNGSYVADMSFVGSAINGAVFCFNPADPPYISQSPYIQNCTNFIPNSEGLRIDGDHCIGPFKSMVVDSYTQYNQGGIGAYMKNEAYAQLVSMFTICCGTAIKCESGGGCDLTNSNSSFGTYGLVSTGVSDLKHTGVVSAPAPEGDNIIRVNIGTTTYNVQTASYNNTTGILTITTTANHNIQAGMDVDVRDLLFSCSSGGAPSNQLFPSGNNGYIFTVKTTPAANQLTVNVGTSTIVHNYVSGGTVKINAIRPFDGQAVYFNTLYYNVLKIDIVDGGSGYTTPPVVTIGDPSAPWGITAQGVATIYNGTVVGVELISSGRGYSSSPPVVTIAPPSSGTQANATAVMVPSYFLVQSSVEVTTGIYDITFKDSLPYPLSISDTAYFFKQSRLLASGHSFEYIGSGTNIETAVPRNGGVPIQENETVSENGGIVVYTSTDHSGNFRIGDGVVIDQTLGRISGEFYSKSLFSTMTPFILALGA